MESDGQLVQRAREGDHDSFGKLVDRYRDVVYGLGYHLTGDFEAARDLAQEALVQAYAKLGQLRDPERFAGWLRQIAENLHRQQLRRRQLTTVPLDGESLSARPSPSPSEAELALRQALARLRQADRVALVLHYIGGYTLAETGAFLGIRPEAVKTRLARARQRLQGEMMTMVEDHLRAQRLSPEFKQEVLKRIGHWERFRGSAEEKQSMVEGDPEWLRLMEVELSLEPVSTEGRAIRKQIASLEPCHEHYVENVTALLEMVGSMRPGRVLDCGQACDERRQEAALYAHALETWLNAESLPRGCDSRAREVFSILGERTEAKAALVAHLSRKLAANAYRVYADEDEDFELTESRIQHLQICNYNWQKNLHIVMQEIAAGKRLFGWHLPDGYNAHGDCPDRVADLRDTMAAAAAWTNGNAGKAGRWARILGEPTPEKRWLVASLCKHVSSQHGKHGGDRLLARPAL